MSKKIQTVISYILIGLLAFWLFSAGMCENSPFLVLLGLAIAAGLICRLKKVKTVNIHVNWVIGGTFLLALLAVISFRMVESRLVGNSVSQNSPNRSSDRSVLDSSEEARTSPGGRRNFKIFTVYDVPGGTLVPADDMHQLCILPVNKGDRFEANRTWDSPNGEISVDKGPEGNGWIRSTDSRSHDYVDHVYVRPTYSVTNADLKKEGMKLMCWNK